VTSEVGSGSAFTILWPQSERSGDKDTQQDEDTKFIGTEHILLVEDDPSVRLFTSQALRHSGYSVVEAVDGPSAIETFQNTAKPIDLLLTDMILPGITGLDLYRSLKEKDGNLKVLFISGYTNTNILNTMEADERENFLHKPFGISDLMRTIRRVLEESDKAAGRQSDKATKQLSNKATKI
jgi:two-component system cell cycle sensor histidine kinase/response regulator CckA